MELIDKAALPEHKFPEVQCNGFGDGPAYRQGWNDAIDAIVENEPTVDAVEVVRCRDCKLSERYTARDGNQYYYCVEHGSKWQEENDYCSYGEKDGDRE